MNDFGRCARQGGHDVPDPSARALASALTRVRVETAAKSDAQSALAAVRREVAELQAVIAKVRREMDITNMPPNLRGVVITVDCGTPEDELLQHISARSRRVRALVNAAPSDVLAAHDAQVKADALEGFTTEWGHGLGDGKFLGPQMDEVHAQATIRYWPEHDYRVMSRLVGPWVEVRGTGTPTPPELFPGTQAALDKLTIRKGGN